MDYWMLVDDVVHIVFAISMAVTMWVFLRILRELLEIRTAMTIALDRLERIVAGSSANTISVADAPGPTSKEPS